MKPKLKSKLEESPQDQILDILDVLCSKYKNMEKEIEFLLNPKKFNQTQSYYNRYVKNSIDTNSWSKFPNKGVVGLDDCLTKMRLFISINNVSEAQKMALAIINVIDRTMKNYNSQNIEELKRIKLEALKL
ncbi:MAG: hypothetical protein ACRCXZ_01715 [Patescibacteria group bacterium]